MNKAQRRFLAKQLRRVHSGDGAAVRNLYDALAAPVYYGILRMLRSEREATALTREVFLDLFAELTPIQTPEALVASAARLAYRKSLRLLRQGDRLSPPISEKGGDLAQLFLPPDYVDDPEKTALVHRALDQLGDEERAVTLLHYYDGFEMHEIAATLDCDLPGVKRQLHCAQGALARLIFDGKGGGLNKKTCVKRNLEH